MGAMTIERYLPIEPPFFSPSRDMSNIGVRPIYARTMTRVSYLIRVYPTTRDSILGFFLASKPLLC